MCINFWWYNHLIISNIFFLFLSEWEKIHSCVVIVIIEFLLPSCAFISDYMIYDSSWKCLSRTLKCFLKLLHIFYKFVFIWIWEKREKFVSIFFMNDLMLWWIFWSAVIIQFRIEYGYALGRNSANNYHFEKLC